MTEPRFLDTPRPLDLAALVALTGATAPRAAEVSITGIATLDWAGPADVAMAEDAEDVERLAASGAGVCFVRADAAHRAPAGVIALACDAPRTALAQVARVLFPLGPRPRALFGPGVSPGAVVHPDARLEPDVSIDPGAVVGPRAEIGRGAVIGANAVVDAGVRLGRDSAVGPGAYVGSALVGDRVAIHAGARIGHGGTREGSGGAPLPAIGRAIIQDDVEIGANAAVSRGALGDTIVGEGSRIGALVRIGADAEIGRFCVVLSPASVADGETIRDFRILGARSADDAGRRLQDGTA